MILLAVDTVLHKDISTNAGESLLTYGTRSLVELTPEKRGFAVMLWPFESGAADMCAEEDCNSWRRLSSSCMQTHNIA